MLAQAQFDLGQAELALSAAFAVQAKLPLRRMSARAVDRCCPGGSRRLGHGAGFTPVSAAKLDNPTLDDLHAVMRCAENAGQSETLVETSRRALMLDPEDVLALHGLAIGSACMPGIIRKPLSIWF